MRLLLELFVVGLPIPSEKVFEILRETIIQPQPKDLVINTETASMFATLFNFEILRKRGNTLNRMYNNYDELDSIFEYDAFVPADKINKFMFGMDLYMNSLKDQLKQAYNLKMKEEKRLSYLDEVNEVTTRAQDNYERARAAYVQLFSIVQKIADYLEMDFEITFGN